MNRFLKHILLAGLILPATAFAKNYSLQMSFCDPQSRCQTCIETVFMTITVDPVNKVATASGKTPEGELVQSPIEGCQISSVDDWQCSSFRGVMAAAKGKIRYTPARPLTVDGKTYEMCVTNVRS